MCFFVIFFQLSVYKYISPLFIALFAQFKFQCGWNVYAEVVVNVIMYMFIRPAVDSHSMQLFVESRGNVKSVSC